MKIFQKQLKIEILRQTEPKIRIRLDPFLCNGCSSLLFKSQDILEHVPLPLESDENN